MAYLSAGFPPFVAGKTKEKQEKVIFCGLE